MTNEASKTHKKRLAFRKDDSIDTKRVDTYRITLEPFIFQLFCSRDQFQNEFSDQTQLRHNHRNFEFHCFIEGNGTFEAGDNVFTIASDSFCLIGPRVYHVQHSDMPTLKYTFQFDYFLDDRNPEALKTPWCKELMNALSTLTYINVEKNTSIPLQLKEMKTELDNLPVFYEYRIHNILSDIMIDILRSVVKEKIVAARKNTEEDMRDFKIEIFFDENYWRTDLTAREMANSIGISTRHLNRLIEKNFHLTFNQKLTQTRIESAKGFLASTDSTIQSIAENTGFNSTEYFYKSFKHETGFTPGEYRLLHKVKSN